MIVCFDLTLCGFLLRDRFSSIYDLAADREVRVSKYLEDNSSSVVWSSVFERDALPEDDSVV